MIVDERMITFINSLDHGLTPFLEELREKAAEDNVPIIRREMQSFLKVFLRIQRPQRILEVGTAIGFSTILMAACGPESSRITTIENYEKRIPVARENFRKSGYEDRITLLEGDAADVLKTLAGPYDFIFMDAAKGQYIHFLPEVLRLMRPGSVLISDNVLQEGDIIESHYIVERRKRTIYKRMRDYLRALKDDRCLETSIVPLGDGISISVMKQPEEI
ncbi:MAG: O-methyltransferase [Eubacterium sp.]|nr:O-methyltransferase [Eubacterium sp.]MDY5112280.1 O-methyltransferase [Bilifractor sp.]